MSLFDQNGLLILPEGARIEFERNSKRIRNLKRRTGVYVSCPGCGHEWERASRKEGRIRCHRCKSTIKVDKIEKERGLR